MLRPEGWSNPTTDFGSRRGLPADDESPSSGRWVSTQIGQGGGADPPSAIEDIDVVASPTFTHDGGRSASPRVR